MPQTTDRIPILVTRAQRKDFKSKAQQFGFRSIGEFARSAMQHFQPSTGDEADLDAVLNTVKQRTREVKDTIARTMKECHTSDARMQVLDEWINKEGYAL